MRTLPVALTLLCAAALSACGNAADGSDGSGAGSTTETSAASTPASPADALWGRTFLSTSVTGSTIPGGGPLEVAFPERGHIAMSAGCNRGVSSVDLTTGTVQTGPIATTKMACPGSSSGADEWMTNLFAAHPAWTLTDDSLTLASGEVTVNLVDKNTTEPDRPVIGTTWVVESLISPTAVVTSAALESSAPTLTIGQDGQVTGSTGCNRFRGPVRVGDNTITFGTLATTRTACPDDVTDIDRAVRHVLDGQVTYTVDGATMDLMQPDGTGLHLRGN